MIKSLFQINLDYRKAINQAEELEVIARDMRNLAQNDFNSTLNSIAANWEGENSQKFVNKGQTLKGKIESNASAIEKTAGTIRRIAERTRTADINARNIALSSGGFGGR